MLAEVLIYRAFVGRRFAATNGNTALVDAVKNQDAESVRALLKQHVDVNAS